MSVQKRKCSSCAFFNESPLPGNGWCTHHKRQQSSEVRILVRKGELACRDPWGSDFWTSKADNDVAADSRESIRQAPPAPLVAAPRADDQITSITASLSSQTSRPDAQHAVDLTPSQEMAPDDVIVSQPSMLPEDVRSSVSDRPFERDRDDFNPNLPAHEDQQERVRIIARGNRDAIMKARERVVLRRGGSNSEPAAIAHDDDEAHGGEPSGHDVADEAVGSDRFGHGAEVPVSRRYGRRPQERGSGYVFPSRGYADPTPPVPREEAGDQGRLSPLVSRRIDADRFESVPEVKPDVALPRLRQFLQATSPEADAQEGPSRNPGGQPETSYDRVLQRAQAIKTATQKERTARVIRNRPVADAQPVALHPSASAIERDDSSVRPSTPAVSRANRDDLEDSPLDTGSFIDDVNSGDEPPRHGVSDADDMSFSFDDDEYPDDELYAEHDAPYDPAGDRSQLGPRDSWWRGLSLGLRRRPQSYDMAANQPDETDVHEDEDWSGEDVLDTSGWSENRPNDERETSDTFERVFSFAGAKDGTATGEPSALLRDSRTAEEELIDYELTDEVLETSFADDTDRIQAESWREDRDPRTRSRDNDISDAGRSRQEPGFAFNDRHDMDAFRAALFGSSPEDSAERREPRRGRPQPDLRQAPPAPTRTQGPAHQRERLAPGALTATPPQRYVEEPTFDIRNFVDQDDDLLDMRVQIAPDVPRACQTCRNFRPSETGERGWCTNDFAFTHRQMVNANDMPCQSSIGCWWLPGDHSWMPTEELASRENSTPLTDRLIARRHGHDVEDDRANSELYVREI